MNSKYNQAVKYFKEKQYKKAFEIFWELKAYYECGYCKFISGDIDLANLCWEYIDVDSPALNWGKNVISLVNLKVPNGLSFFQIRNFLERDIQLLLENSQIKMVENIISAADILAEYNPEVYKFIGRVLLLNNYYDLARTFLLKSKDICYKDSEVHFLLAQYYLSQNNIAEAINILKISVGLNSAYFPAKKLLNKLLAIV